MLRLEQVLLFILELLSIVIVLLEKIVSFIQVLSLVPMASDLHQIKMVNFKKSLR